ncbi:MFS transporter [Umezawaea tangerina]|uniref:EmrB/QacA subfamily drug resistance transporter n=1 Tax=Umezawaea tangerina TaxID=84725 RepID=A0A2T0T218_9PSEU|nr:MFS transporter [Umezawaea tangerina]PRY39702.1 EmrB/QacA subfamily drug resistance transporter [Umezawaea tangerina]
MNATQAMPATVDRPSRPGLVLVCVCVCTVLVVGLVAAINLAVPQLAASGLSPSSSQLLWIVDAYVVVFACLVIPGGAAGDRFGRKGVLVAGLVTFAVGAVVSASSPTVAIMLVGRVVTGLGAAMVLPNCVGVLVHATPPERRGRALAVWGAVSGMGGIVGNIGGGALLTGGTWRTLFAVVASIALVCAVWVVRATSRSDRASRALDPVGTALFVAAVVALLIGVIEAPEQGWGSAVVVTALVLAVVVGAGWVVFELRATHPLLDPRLFRIPLLSSAAFGMSVMFFGSFGLFYVNASLLQYGRGYTVLQAGLGTLPLALPLLLVSRLVPDLVRRTGIPVVLTAAFAAIGTGLFGLSTATGQPYPAYAAWLVVVGIGFALALPCLTAELTAALPAEQAGVAGGLQAATRELGSALGVAVVGTVLTAAFTGKLPEGLKGHEPAAHTVAEALAAAPAEHDAVVAAFVAGADTALRVTSVLTLLAGAVVVAGALRAARSGRHN